MGITYDQGSEFICHVFRKHLIEKEYGNTANSGTLGNPTSNVILELIYQVLGNLVQNLTLKEPMLTKMTYGQSFYQHLNF